MRTAIAVALSAVGLGACAPGATWSGNVESTMAATVAAWRQRTPVPAVVAMVSGPGVGNHVVAGGTLYRGGEERVTVDTRFRAASVTKMLVATVVLQLQDEGRLSLDEAVAKSLPVDAPVSSMLRGVTVRDLLAHTSGLPDVNRSAELTRSLIDDPGRRWTTAEVLRLATDKRPEFPPGSAYGYSNTNYLVLANLIEQVTGRPWHREIRERILDPLGMTDSFIAGFEEPTAPLAPGYFDLDNDGFTEKVADPWPALETSEGAAGALVSTASDIVTFLKGLAGGKLVPRPLVDEMTKAGPYASRYTGYGLGVEVSRPDMETRVWGHGGYLPGFRAVAWHVPSRDMTVVVLTNETRSRPDGLAELLLKQSIRRRSGDSKGTEHPKTPTRSI